MLLQGEELEPARIKAEKAGVKQIFIDDLREDFVGNYVFPMFRCTGLLDRLHGVTLHLQQREPD